MGIEDDLFNMFKHANLGGSKGINDLLTQLVSSTQIRLLKDMRSQMDKVIRELEGAQGTDGLNPYTILGVDPKATKDDIDKAFKKKAWKAHPDHGGCNEEMVKVNAAYEVIRRIRGWK